MIRVLKSFAKQITALIARILVLPMACLSGFGHWQTGFQLFAECLALAPGLAGSYLRIAYYSFTIERVGSDCRIGFGSYLAHPQASLASRVNIGSYCVLGQVSIGEGTFLASHVQILSGKRQHVRDGSGKLTDDGRIFRRVSVGRDCWIGAGAIIAADVGPGVTLRPGCVVLDPVAEGMIMTGNPAVEYVKPAKLAV
ncbi:MAG: acyltransferase [Acidobacteriota bacterium]|nr:acyltransferase [Acidobacteriota bacterium]